MSSTWEFPPAAPTGNVCTWPIEGFKCHPDLVILCAFDNDFKFLDTIRRARHGEHTGNEFREKNAAIFR